MKGVIVMFRYNVRGENIEVTEAIRDYVEKKVGKLERYFSDSPEATVHVNLKVYTLSLIHILEHQKKKRHS